MDKKLAILIIIIGAALVAYGLGSDMSTVYGSYIRFAFLFAGIMMITLTYMFYEKKT